MTQVSEVAQGLLSDLGSTAICGHLFVVIKGFWIIYIFFWKHNRRQNRDGTVTIFAPIEQQVYTDKTSSCREQISYENNNNK
jgi:hypothetical protein